MKKLIYIAFTLLAITACNSNKKNDTRLNSSAMDTLHGLEGELHRESIQHKISILNLQKSFIAKNEVKFFNQFPKDFNQFHNYFGWNNINDEPEELYEESYSYIDYWFNLLNSNKYKEYEKSIISICTNGKWEADAVNYFQDKSLNYIKEKQKYHLINELKDMEANSVLFFLFDGPHPQFDIDFASHLSASKKVLLNELFETTFSDEHSLKSNDINFYTNNDSYFIKDIDINNDGILDKIISNKPYQGEELLLFVSTNNSYKLALKTINFSQDGGNIIKTIKKDENGFVIITFFPDGGFLEAHYYVSFLNNEWILTNTVYKTKSSNQEDSFTYLCDVKQGINLNNPNFLDDLKSIPDETDRERVCTKENEYKLATIDSVSIKEIKKYINVELPSIFDYYKQEKKELYTAWSPKLFGRCCSNADLTFSQNLYFKISSNYNNKKYPITNISDTSYSTAFVFKPNLETKINVQLDLNNSFLHGKYSNKNLLSPNEIVMNPIKLSIINGYVKSEKLFYENGRVKKLNVYVNNIFIQSIILIDTPLVQEFKVNTDFKTTDNITLVPETYYKGSKYDDICISEIQTNLGETALPGLNDKYNLMELMNE